MKKLLTFLVLILGTSAVHAQTPPGFNKRFTIGYPNTRIFKLLVEQDTIVALGDGYGDSTALNRGIILMKFDTLGSLLYSNHIYDTIFGTFPLQLRWGSLLPTSDGGYIMNITPYLYEYPTILKTDHDFNLEYIKNYQEAGDYDYQLCDILPVSDGYLLFGSVGRVNGFNDGYVRKINLNGDSIWLKSYGSFGSSESVNDVKILNDTTFAVSMVYHISAGSALSSIKIINHSGEVLNNWSSAPNPEIGYLREILSANEDGYLVYGLYPLEFLPPFDMLVQSTISRLDKDFNVLWSKRYGKEVSLSSEVMFYNFNETIDGNYIGVGKTFLSSPNNGPSYGRGWLMKFSPEGDSIWSRQDTSDVMPVHYLNQHVLGGMGVLSSGSIVAGGYVTKGQADYAWLIKVTNDGCLDTLYCGLVSGAGEEVPEEAHQVNVYPNPANDIVTVETVGEPTMPFSASVHDAWGRLATINPEAEEGRVSLSVQNLPNGVYFLTLKFPDGRIRYEKITIQH